MRPSPDRLLDDFRPQPLPVFDRILVPSDGSRSSRNALDLAVRLASSFAAALRVVLVLEPGATVAPEAADAVLRDAAVCAAGEGVPAEVEVRRGPVVEELLLDVAEWRADLVVVGTHAREEALTPALGRNTGELLRKITVPVLVVR